MLREFLSYLGFADASVASARAVVGSGSYHEHERLEIVEMIPRDATTVLDVGCAAGAFGAALKRRSPGLRVVGIEYAEGPASLARERLDEVLQLDLNSLSEGQIPGSFDVIVCADVIEHLLDPERLLSLLASHLMPGGVLVLSVPNVRHWSVLAPLLIDDLFTYADEGLLDRTHVHLFTYTELVQMLGRSGWKPIDLRLVEIAMPARFEVMVELAGALGGDPLQSRRLMNAFQFLVAAVR